MLNAETGFGPLMFRYWWGTTRAVTVTSSCPTASATGFPCEREPRRKSFTSLSAATDLHD
jgi:hypothetical protein